MKLQAGLDEADAPELSWKLGVPADADGVAAVPFALVEGFPVEHDEVSAVVNINLEYLTPVSQGLVGRLVVRLNGGVVLNPRLLVGIRLFENLFLHEATNSDEAGLFKTGGPNLDEEVVWRDVLRRNPVLVGIVVGMKGRSAELNDA